MTIASKRIPLAVAAISLSFCLFSCAGDPGTIDKRFLVSRKVVRREKMELSRRDFPQVGVPDDCFNTYDHFSNLNDSLVYMLSFRNKWKIDKYDLVKKAYAGSVILDKNFLKTGIRGFEALAKDSIFAVNDEEGILYIFNDQGNIVKKTRLQREVKVGGKDYHLRFLTIFPYYKPIILGSNQVLLPISPEGSAEISGTENCPRIGIYDMDNGKLVRSFGKQEGLMKNKGKLFYPKDVSMPYVLQVGDSTIISYPMDHDIYVYDTRTGNLIGTKTVSSKDVGEFPGPISKGKIENSQQAWNFRVSIPFYEPVFYNKRQNIFTRAVHFPQSTFDASDKLNTGQYREAAVMVCDRSFEILGETKIRNSQYGVHKVIPLSYGMLVAPHDFYVRDEDRLVYQNLYLPVKKTE